MDKISEARQRRDDAMSDMGEQHERMKDDLRFSNPTEPEQWDIAKDRKNNKTRVTIAFDRTNQYVRQVVNKGKKMRPSIIVSPVDQKADVRTARVMGGLLRHMEYQSRASLAYDWALDCSARMGLGYIRLTPEVVDPRNNYQELRIKRVIDPFSVALYDWTEIDGSDASGGSILTKMPLGEFRRRWPKSSAYKADGKASSLVDVIEEFQILRQETNFIVFPCEDGTIMELSENDFHDYRMEENVNPPIIQTYIKEAKTCEWLIYSGEEQLEDETEFPAPYVPIVPVTGLETWIEGKRQFCGVSRMLRSGQIAYNYERCAYLEKVGQAPRSPWTAPNAAVQNYKRDWEQSNVSDKGVLLYDHVDNDGNPIPRPERVSPAPIEAAHAQGAQMAISDMDAAVGMSQHTLMANQAQTSGRALRERDAQADNANFDFTDNLGASIAQVGRIAIASLPRLIDTKRQMKIMGEDGKVTSVTIDPKQGEAAKRTGYKQYCINPNVGEYDLRVKAGPSFGTQQEESADRIAMIMQTAPNFTPALAPMLVRLSNMPDGDAAVRMMLAMVPPEVRAAYDQDDDEEGPPPIPPQAQQQMAQMQQAIKALEAALQNADKEVDAARAAREKIASESEQAAKELEATAAREAAKLNEQSRQHDDKMDLERMKLESATMKDHAEFMVQKMAELTDRLDAETKRMQVIAPAMNEQQIAAIVMQTVQGIMATPVAPQGV